MASSSTGAEPRWPHERLLEDVLRSLEHRVDADCPERDEVKNQVGVELHKLFLKGLLDVKDPSRVRCIARRRYEARLLDFYRERRRHSECLSLMANPSLVQGSDTDVLDGLVRAEDAARMLEVLRNLSPADRELIERAIELGNLHEVAKQSGRGYSGVRKAHSRARARLRAALRN